MTTFLIRRFAWMALTLWIVFTASFFLMRMVPGGPLDQERELEPHVRAQLEQRYHLNEPPLQQYWRELRSVLTGNLGYSMRKGDFSVNEIISQGFPVSAALGIVAMALALALGTTAGIVSAIKRGSVWDFSLMTIATVGIALPNFVIAGIAIILLCFLVPIFPAAGWQGLWYLPLPAFCLGAPYAAYVARLVRTGMLDVMGQDYIRTAYAKGLMTRGVVLRHALRGALLPVVSFIGPATAGIMTGSLVVEQIFAIPGVGVTFISSALERDYTLSMGLVLIYTTLLYTMNTLVDISYSLLDPRVKLE